MALPHPMHVFVAAGRRRDAGLQIERYEHGFHARAGEVPDDLILALRGPRAVPVFAERFYVGPLAVYPFLRAGIAVQIDDPHSLLPLTGYRFVNANRRGAVAALPDHFHQRSFGDLAESGHGKVGHDL